MVATGLATEAHGLGSTDVLRRFARPIHGPAFWAALWAATVAVELVALGSIVFADEPVPGNRAFFRLIGGVFCACGLIGWRRRPDSYSGALMVAMGFGLLVEPVFAQFEKAFKLTRGAEVIEAAHGSAFLTPDEDRIRRLELRGVFVAHSLEIVVNLQQEAVHLLTLGIGKAKLVSKLVEAASAALRCA